MTCNSTASAFPNALTALFIFLTLPVTTAAAERSFSKVGVNKELLEKANEPRTLDGLAVLSIESDKAHQMNHRAVAESFANANVRKVCFLSKHTGTCRSLQNH